MMHDFGELITRIEEKANQAEKLESAFARLTISRAANFERSKSVAAKIAVLVGKVKEITDMQEAAKEKVGTELNEAGFNILKTFLDLVFEQEEDLIVGVIADFFDIPHEDARHIPVSIIYECIMKDKVVRTFLPRLAILELRAQSDILPSQTGSPSPLTPSTSEQGMKKSLTGSDLKVSS